MDKPFLTLFVFFDFAFLWKYGKIKADQKPKEGNMIHRIAIAFFTLLVSTVVQAQQHFVPLAASEPLDCGVTINRFGQWVNGQEPATLEEFDKLFIAVRAGLLSATKDDGCRTISNKSVVFIKLAMDPLVNIRVTDQKTLVSKNIKVKLEGENNKDVISKVVAAVRAGPTQVARRL